MRKFTFYFELFGKKGKYVCTASNRASADVQFKDMIMRNTTFTQVIDEVPEPKEPHKPGKGSSIEDRFSSFSDIFGKDFPFNP